VNSEIIKKAWDDVSKYSKKIGDKKEYGEKFRDYIRRIASSIIELGLVATVAFIYSKTNAEKFQRVKDIFEQREANVDKLDPDEFAWASILYFLTNFLADRHGYPEEPKDAITRLLDEAVEKPSALVHSEQETVIYLDWLKNFSEPLWG